MRKTNPTCSRNRRPDEPTASTQFARDVRVAARKEASQNRHNIP